MASTTFVDYSNATPITASWLNDVNRLQYTILGNPVTSADINNVLGIVNAAHAGGTADALTATYTTPPTAFVDGLVYYVRAASANATTTPTFTPNSGVLAATTITHSDGSALRAGDIAGAGHWLVLQYDTALTKWILLNPAFKKSSQAENTAGTGTGVVASVDFPASVAALVSTQSATQAASGTAVSFTGIPATAKRITMNLSGVTTSGTSQLVVRIGNTTYDTTGYTGDASGLSNVVGTTNYTGGFGLSDNNASSPTYSGTVVLNLLDATSHTWTYISQMYNLSTKMSLGAGSKAVASAVDRIQLTTLNGTDTFTAGSISIKYE